MNNIILGLLLALSMSNADWGKRLPSGYTGGDGALYFDSRSCEESYKMIIEHIRYMIPYIKYAKEHTIAPKWNWQAQMRDTYKKGLHPYNASLMNQMRWNNNTAIEIADAYLRVDKCKKIGKDTEVKNALEYLLEQRTDFLHSKMKSPIGYASSDEKTIGTLSVGDVFYVRIFKQTYRIKQVPQQYLRTIDKVYIEVLNLDGKKSKILYSPNLEAWVDNTKQNLFEDEIFKEPSQKDIDKELEEILN